MIDDTIKQADTHTDIRSENSKLESLDSTIDPFSLDLFASERQLSIKPDIPLLREDINKRKSEDVKWYSRLQKVSVSELKLSNLLTKIPNLFFEEILDSSRRVISNYTNIPAEEISLSIDSLRELNTEEVSSWINQERHLFASLTLNPASIQAAIRVHVDLLIQVCDLLLGGNGQSPSRLRNLSIAEQSVVEFLLLSIIKDLKAQVESPSINLSSLVASAPDWIKSICNRDTNVGKPVADGSVSRAILTSLRIKVGNVTGTLETFITVDSLLSLSAAKTISSSSNNSNIESVNRLYQLVGSMSDVPTSFIVGEVDLDISEFQQLEVDDVILLDRLYGEWKSAISGSLRVRVGEGNGLILIGKVEEPKDSVVNIRIEAVVNNNNSSLMLERVKMEETKEEQQATGKEQEKEAVGVEALEGLQLTLHVEIASRRVSLNELSQLRIGQLLDLGCNVTDPVDLLVDGRSIALGELVDIEGRLGVRITQLAG
jgi:flagellar motor switch/type III secretory pathway protein FliN